ncbi:CDP-diacylglycerol--glycerol-3-phosphate 3-phosphatidyltransferase [Tulasnella sp. UAMH 9824]|nr:CDP-diacylglycerol--glycerol-3-phosphate 3-phosphatidyltransferase [Tulasnella sp. UAMH 9824]
MLRTTASRPVRVLLRTPKNRLKTGPAFSTSSSKRSPTETLVTALSATQPRFNLSGTDVRVLRTPTEYYGNLIDMIKRAKRRIVLSSLYIGTAEKELLQTLHNALQSNPQLTLDLHLDLLRSTRPETPSTAEFLLPLIKSFGEDRVRIHFFRTPKLKGLTAKLVPRRFDEGWGTWHAKLYAVDDEVMISGANLNSSYFTDRQDRYLHFKNQPSLTNYVIDYASTMIPFTHRLVPVPGRESGPESYRAEWRNQQTGPMSFEAFGKKAFETLQERWRTSQPVGPNESDTAIFPVIQSGVLGVREEEMVIDRLFECISESTVPATVDLTSGYFGLYAPYKSRILSSPDSIRWRIVAAAPKANGFYGSKGISGRLPEAYTWLERRFWAAASKAGKISPQDSKVELSEWERQGWTYHAKGIWVRFGEDDSHHGSKPTMSLFGSTNLNSRSANLDTELSFMMVTSSRELSETLAEEVDGIRENASVVGRETWERSERRVRLSTIAMAKMVAGML